MQDDPRTEPLREWNRLARENTENAVVASMFDAAMKATEPITTFTDWLLLATGAVASFLIANADNVLPYISKAGFLTCGAFLCLSCMFGLLSKLFSMRCKIGIETGSAVRATFAQHLAAYKLEEERIREGAEFWGINLQTGIRIERVLNEFLRPFPSLVKWIANRHFKKEAGNPQIAYVSQIKSLNAQGLATFLQAMAFLGFLCSGFIFAAA